MLGNISKADEKTRIIGDLVRYLADVHEKWFEIGVLLGVSISKLYAIDKDQYSSEEKLRRLLEVRTYVIILKCG